MSEYRDWQHPEGGPPETAPDRLVDVFTAPWLDTAAGSPAAALGAASTDGRWLVALGALVAGLVLIQVWRRRRDLVLAVTLARLERAARRLGAGASLRGLQDRAAVAVARWQHGGRAPRRDRLSPPWSDWVHQLDHARFATIPADDPAELAAQLRRMRRALWRRRISA